MLKEKSFIFTFEEGEKLDVFGLGKVARFGVQNIPASVLRYRSSTDIAVSSRNHSRHLKSLQLDIIAAREEIKRREDSQRQRLTPSGGFKRKQVEKEEKPGCSGKKCKVDVELAGARAAGQLSEPDKPPMSGASTVIAGTSGVEKDSGTLSTDSSVGIADDKAIKAELAKLRLQALRTLALRKRQKVESCEGGAVGPVAGDGIAAAQKETSSVSLLRFPCDDEVSTDIKVNANGIQVQQALSNKEKSDVVVIGVCTNVTQAQMLALCEPYGVVVNIFVEKVKKGKKNKKKNKKNLQNFFVRFESLESARRAKNGLTGVVLEGTTVSVGLLGRCEANVKAKQFSWKISQYLLSTAVPVSMSAVKEPAGVIDLTTEEEEDEEEEDDEEEDEEEEEKEGVEMSSASSGEAVLAEAGAALSCLESLVSRAGSEIDRIFSVGGVEHGLEEGEEEEEEEEDEEVQHIEQDVNHGMDPVVDQDPDLEEGEVREEASHDLPRSSPPPSAREKLLKLKAMRDRVAGSVETKRSKKSAAMTPSRSVSTSPGDKQEQVQDVEREVGWHDISWLQKMQALRDRVAKRQNQDLHLAGGGDDDVSGDTLREGGASAHMGLNEWVNNTNCWGFDGTTSAIHLSSASAGHGQDVTCRVAGLRAPPPPRHAPPAPLPQPPLLPLKLPSAFQSFPVLSPRTPSLNPSFTPYSLQPVPPAAPSRLPAQPLPAHPFPPPPAPANPRPPLPPSQPFHVPSVSSSQQPAPTASTNYPTPVSYPARATVPAPSLPPHPTLPISPRSTTAVGSGSGVLGSVNNSDVDLLRLEALRLSALWRLNVSAPLAAPVAPESSSAVREGADETIGVPAIFPQMQLKVLNIDAVVRSHGLDVSAVKVGVTDVRGVEGNDKCCELLVAEDQHEGGEKGAVNGGIDVDDTVNTSIRAQGRGESTGGCLDHVGMDRHGCERSSNVDTERINIGFKMNENDDISNLDEMSNNLNLNYDESIDDCRDMSVTHRITIDGIVHSNQSAKINTANSKNATSSNHDDDGRGVAKRARLTPPSSDQNHAVAIADATTSFLTRLTQNDSSLSTTASVVVVDTICSSSSSSMPRVDATTRDLLRLQAREQLLAREQELAHKIEVQRVRNEIKRAEALLSFQSSKLAKARKVHENLCLVEKDQYRLLSSLRKTKQQLLQRSAKSSLYRIEMMADVSSARLQQSLVEKVTKEAKDREEQALSAASAAAGGSKR